MEISKNLLLKKKKKEFHITSLNKFLQISKNIFYTNTSTHLPPPPPSNKKNKERKRHSLFIKCSTICNARTPSLIQKVVNIKIKKQ